ncbi:MAG: amidohydrolase family protein [Polyangiaceae bacterium]
MYARFLAVIPLLLASVACADPEGGGEPSPDASPSTDIPQIGPPIPRDGGADVQVSPEASTDAGDGGAPLTVVPGVAGRTLLRGTILATSGAIEGEVLVEGDRITCVGPSCAASPGANGASVIETNGVISPGLIDTHNHILFDIFDDSDWLPARRYANHDEWPNEPRYQAMLDVKQCLEDASQGKPTWCPATYDGAGSLKCEMDKFGELKGIVAGTTSIVGLSGTTSACFSSVARTIDAPQNGLGQDKIQTSALFPPSRSAADGVCSNFTSARTDAYLIHVGEGVDARSLGELDRLGTVSTTPGCLYAPQTTVTHGTAFGAPEFARMAAAGMKLTWSPASNVALYGSSTNIPLARAAGVTVTLAPDWSMGGSQNLLDELRFADGWDNAHFGNVLTPKDLFAMVTVNAAAAVALADKIGTLAPGYYADLMVVPRAGQDPFAALLAARPKDVRLTMVGGKILYGDVALRPLVPAAPGCETVDVCTASKLVCVAEADTSSKLGQTYAQIRAALEAAMVDVDTITKSDGYDFAPLAPLVNCSK